MVRTLSDNALAYTPPHLDPLEARFLNALLTRAWPRDFDFFGTPCSFKADPWQVPFSPACCLDIQVRDETWQVLLSSASPMRLHPAGAAISEFADLPEALRLALFELSLSPVLGALADFFDLGAPPAILADSGVPADEFACSVSLTLSLPEEEVSIALRIPGHDAAEALLRRLLGKQRTRRPMPALLLAVSLETGFLSLTVPELAALRPADILLPESYPGLRGEVCLRLSPDLIVRCAVDNGRATVLGFEHSLSPPVHYETRRKEMAETSPEAAPQKDNAATEPPLAAQQAATDSGEAAREHEAAVPEISAALDTLEIAVTFELERRLMSIAEITALTPGYTFTLTADPGGPVTLRANGKSLGTGRLVEVGGALGVQITSLEREA